MFNTNIQTVGKYTVTVKSGLLNKPKVSLQQHTVYSKGLYMKPKDQDKNLVSVQVLINGQRASLVAQWLRVFLPMQGTRVRALV